MSIPYGYVYRITNKINGKTYVGQRKLSLDKQWRQYMGSGVAVKAAIAKYGIDSFVKEFLSYADSYDELNKKEIDLITKERKTGKAEYNLHIGSPVPQNSGGFKNLTPEEKEEIYKKLAAKNKARYRSMYEEIIYPYKESILYLYSEYGSCKKVADELGLSQKQINRFLKEIGIELNSQSIKGRKTSDVVKKRISEGLKKSEVRFTLICDGCNESFESKSSTKKTCLKCVGDYYLNSHLKEALCSIMITVCLSCNTEFEHPSKRRAKFCSHKCSTEARMKELPPIEVIRKLYWEDNFSANQIGTMYKVSGQTIRRYMERNGINRRGERRSP